MRKAAGRKIQTSDCGLFAALAMKVNRSSRSGSRKISKGSTNMACYDFDYVMQMAQEAKMQEAARKTKEKDILPSDVNVASYV